MKHYGLALHLFITITTIIFNHQFINSNVLLNLCVSSWLSRANHIILYFGGLGYMHPFVCELNGMWLLLSKLIIVIFLIGNVSLVSSNVPLAWSPSKSFGAYYGQHNYMSKRMFKNLQHCIKVQVGLLIVFWCSNDCSGVYYYVWVKTQNNTFKRISSNIE